MVLNTWARGLFPDGETRKTFTEDREMRTRDMSNLEVVKGLLDDAANQIDLHNKGLFTTNETLLSLIEIIEKAVDVHCDGGTCKAGEIDENTGLLIRQGEGWTNGGREMKKIMNVIAVLCVAYVVALCVWAIAIFWRM